MSTRFTLKRNDRLPPLRAEILYSDGDPVDLTGATVKFYMNSLATGSNIINASASVVDATLGIVRYSWGSATTGTSGTYRAEFEADYGGGMKLTGPNGGYITIVILDDLVT